MNDDDYLAEVLVEAERHEAKRAWRIYQTWLAAWALTMGASFAACVMGIVFIFQDNSIGVVASFVVAIVLSIVANKAYDNPVRRAANRGLMAEGVDPIDGWPT